MTNSNPPFIGVASLALSLAVNTAIFHTIDQSFHPNKQEAKKIEQKMVQLQKNTRHNKLEFTFVEAPPQKILSKPSPQAKHIAAHDAVNQDLAKIKPIVDGDPSIKNQAIMDQLRQMQASAVPSPPTPASQAVQASQAAPEHKATPEKESTKAETPSDIPSIVKPIEETKKVEEKPSEAKPEQTPQKAQAASPGSTGGDRITTQEFSRSKSSGAKIYGMTSFEATGSGMGVYMKNLKEKIWAVWFPNVSFKYPQDFHTADVVIGFVLDSKGDVKILQVLEDGGNPTFAGYCLDSIQKAGNFGPLSQEIIALLGKEELEIKFAFHYR